MAAHWAGIGVLATGGIGGVHRGDQFDVSADLLELARTPVTVPATMLTTADPRWPGAGATIRAATLDRKKRDGRIELADGRTLTYAGVPLPDGNGRTAVIEVSLQDAKRDASRNIRLGPRDLITVEHTPATVMLELVKIVRFGLGASLTPLF